MLGLLVAHPISIPKASPITQSHETKQFVPFRFVPSVVKVWIRVVGILVIDIVVVAVHGRLPGALVLPRVDPAVGAGLRLRPAASATVPPLDARPGGRLGVVARGRPHDGPSEPTDPVVLLALRVGVQEVGDLPGGDLEGVALPALEVGRLDRVADGQVDHPVGRRVLVGAVKELAALEQKVPAAPVLEPHRLLRQESLVFDVVRVVDNVRVGIDVGRTGHLRTGLAGLLLLLLLLRRLRLGWLRRRPCRLLHLWLLLHSRLLLHRGLLEPWLLLLLHLGLLVVVLLLLLLLLLLLVLRLQHLRWLLHVRLLHLRLLLLHVRLLHLRWLHLLLARRRRRRVVVIILLGLLHGGKCCLLCFALLCFV
mmetsp:Transcript_5587/g.12859  ORF Transcript_5587/g.12859 Transcript_5587/m.12859 type:complete len:366 (+) Transcript_5587:230-1327(+)